MYTMVHLSCLHAQMARANKTKGVEDDDDDDDEDEANVKRQRGGAQDVDDVE